MTKRDKWAKRPIVLRYWAFCDEVRASGCVVPDSNSHITFHIPMPKSWTKKKKAIMLGQPHQQVPDIDNFLKALLDAIYDDDKAVWDVRTTKRWAEVSVIEIVHKPE